MYVNCLEQRAYMRTVSILVIIIGGFEGVSVDVTGHS